MDRSFKRASGPRLIFMAIAVALALSFTPGLGAAGTAASLVKDLNPSADSSPSWLTRVGNTVFFAANDGTHGRELWKTDGTAAGTKMVKNIRPYGKGSFPQYLTNVNGTLFFVANDGTHSRQLWKSDGTRAGTVRVTNIVASDEQYGLDVPVPMVALGSRLFFFSQTCCVGTATLYVTDGMAAGTDEIAYVNGAPREGQTLAHKGKLYFVAETGGEGDEFKSQELWSSNGTMIGTHRVPGTPLAEEIDILPASGANLYFATSNYWPTRVWESRLWKTDGTKSGTKPLTTVGELHGLGSLDAAYMASRLYFSGAYSYGGELWKTDGTAAGTFPLVDLEADPRELTLARSRLFFTVGQDLWRTNGTAAGTSAVRGFEPGMPAEMIAVGDYLYLTVVNWDDGTWTLWKSDGTVSGTNPVRTYSGAPDPLAKAGLNGRLLFAANDGAHGTELWTFKP